MERILKNLPIILLSTLFVTGSVVGATVKSDSVVLFNSSDTVYLGYASIFGDGNSSILEAVVENDLRIKIDSTHEVLDFFIDFNMDCNGAADEGVITLTISLNGENISSNFTQTPFSKNGTLFLRDVEVNRGDSFLFVIHVVYGNAIPFYLNETKATGVAVISKTSSYSIGNDCFIHGATKEIVGGQGVLYLLGTPFEMFVQKIKSLSFSFQERMGMNHF